MYKFNVSPSVPSNFNFVTLNRSAVYLSKKLFAKLLIEIETIVLLCHEKKKL